MIDGEVVLGVQRDLRSFKSSHSLQLKIRTAIWFVTSKIMVEPFFIPMVLRKITLRFWGAKVGRGVVIRSKVRVYYPWNVSIGDNSWIGENVQIINHAFVTVGHDVCISQNSIICSSGHDYKSASLNYRHKEIVIGDGSWISISSVLLGGARIGTNSVVSANETVGNEIPENSLFRDGQIIRIDYP